MVRRILRLVRQHARDLPWRRPDATPWAIMVSEFMLQQTPVERVRGPWQAWLERWPTPASLAAAPPGDAVRAWGRLGYPRRALRLHQAAQMIMNDFDGQVPEDRESLLRLPGVGSYTAAAIGSFAYGRREIVLDTNVRRLLTQIGMGCRLPQFGTDERGSGRWPRSWLRATRNARRAGPSPRWSSAHWCAALAIPSVMPARSRHCVPGVRPVIRPGQGRRGAVRPTRGPTGSAGALCSPCSDPATSRSQIASWRRHGKILAQRNRALASLVQDGLVVATGNRWSLPG